MTSFLSTFDDDVDYPILVRLSNFRFFSKPPFDENFDENFDEKFDENFDEKFDENFDGILNENYTFFHGLF